MIQFGVVAEIYAWRTKVEIGLKICQLAEKECTVSPNKHGNWMSIFNFPLFAGHEFMNLLKTRMGWQDHSTNLFIYPLFIFQSIIHFSIHYSFFISWYQLTKLTIEYVGMYIVYSIAMYSMTSFLREEWIFPSDYLPLI